MINSTLAPIVLFVYGRPAHTRQTLEALSQNDLSQESVLYIFADGAKPTASAEQLEKIRQTRDVIREKQWCGQVHIIESEINKGLAHSIIEGVTRIVNEYGKVIVLEDDIVTSVGFLRYMNDALMMYCYEEQVMQISGYWFVQPATVPPLPDTFFITCVSSWSWATWKRAWQYFESDGKLLEQKIMEQHLKHRFDFEGTYPYFQMLTDYNEGKNNSWAIRWYAVMCLRGAIALFPCKSLVYNIGFDGSGEHCDSSMMPHKDVIDYLPIEKIDLIQELPQARQAFHAIHGSSQSTIIPQSILGKFFRKIKSLLMVK